MDRPKTQSLNELVRACALDKIRQFSGYPTVVLEELGEHKPILGHWMSIILVSGEQLHLTLKTHFSTGEVAKFMPMSPDMINLPRQIAMARDFVKEFSNLTAGSIKLALHNQGIPTGISLPLVTRGFDELFEQRGPGQLVESDRWQLVLDDAKLIVSTEFQVGKGVELKDPGQSGENQGDVEFL